MGTLLRMIGRETSKRSCGGEKRSCRAPGRSGVSTVEAGPRGGEDAREMGPA